MIPRTPLRWFPSASKSGAGIPVIDMLTPLDKKAMQDAGIEVGYFGPEDREATRMVGDVRNKRMSGRQGCHSGRCWRQERRIASSLRGRRQKPGKLDLLDSRTAHWETEEANTVFSNMLAAHPDIRSELLSSDAFD